MVPDGAGGYTIDLSEISAEQSGQVSTWMDDVNDPNTSDDIPTDPALEVIAKDIGIAVSKGHSYGQWGNTAKNPWLWDRRTPEPSST